MACYVSCDKSTPQRSIIQFALSLSLQGLSWTQSKCLKLCLLSPEIWTYMATSSYLLSEWNSFSSNDSSVYSATVMLSWMHMVSQFYKDYEQVCILQTIILNVILYASLPLIRKINWRIDALMSILWRWNLLMLSVASLELSQKLTA